MPKLSTTILCLLLLFTSWTTSSGLAQCGAPGIPMPSTTSWDYTNFFGTAQTPLNGSVVVGAGTTIDISNQTIFLRTNGRIIVREGGTFIANNCKFTTTSTTETWKGFLVEGGSSSQGQTRLQLTGCDLDHAYTAVTEGCDPVNDNSGNSRVVLDNCTILSPREVGVDLRPKLAPGSSGIFNCNFTHKVWPFPNPTMVNINGVCGTSLIGNNFLNDSYKVYMKDAAERGTAIRVSNATALIRDNVIRQWHIGIDAKEDAGCGPLHLDDNTIKNCIYGAILDGQDAALVENGQFTLNRKIEEMILPSTVHGKIFMDALTILGNPVELRIRKNNFKHREDQAGTPPAYQDWNAVVLDKTIGTLVEGNLFTFSLIDSRVDLNRGVKITGSNPSTQLRCNDFDLDPDRVGGQIAVFLAGSTAELGTQGSATVGTGNIFRSISFCLANWHLARTNNAGTFLYWVSPSLTLPPTCNSSGVLVNTATGDRSCVSSKQNLMADQLEAKDLKVYPNPTTGQARLEVPSGFTGMVDVFTMTGQRAMPSIAVQPTMKLDLSHLPKGIYLIRAGNASQKIILQ